MVNKGQQPSTRPGRKPKTLRRFARLGAAVLLLVIMAIGATFWRLSDGPISLGPLVPRLEQTLTDLVPPNVVTCSDVVLTWNGWRNPFDIRVADVALTAPENREIARFETLGVNLDFLSLLRGELRPGAISLRGLHLTAIRDTDGKLDFQMGRKKATNATPTGDPTVWLRTWLDPKERGPLQRLQHLQIVGASLEVTDQTLGQTWGADDLTIDVKRTPTGFDTSLTLSVALASTNTPLSAKATYAKADQSLKAHLEFAGLIPSDLANVTPSLDPLRGIDLTADASIDVIIHKDLKIEVSAFEVTTAAGTLSGKVNTFDPKKKITGTFEIHGLRPSVLAQHVEILKPVAGLRFPIDMTIQADLEALRPRLVDFDIRVGGGFIDIPKPIAKAQPLVGATLEGRLEGLDTLMITRGSIDLGEGTVVNLTSTIDIAKEFVTINGEADIASLTVEKIHELWPSGAAEGARTWVSDHISAGSVENIHGELEIGQSEEGFGLRRLAGKFGLSDLQLELFPDIPMMDHISGTASFSASGFDFDVSSAQMNDLEVITGKVIISGFDHPPALLQIDVTVEGPITTALALVNKPPLAFVDPEIIDARDVSGNANTRIKLTSPLDGPMSGTVDTFNVDAQVQDFAWSNPMIGPPATLGQFSLKVTPSLMTIFGAANFGKTLINIDLHEYFSESDLVRKILLQGDIDKVFLHSLGLPESDFLNGAIAADVTYSTDRTGKSTVEGNFNLENSEIKIPQIHWHKPVGAAGLLSASATTIADGGWMIAPISLTADGFRADARLALTESPQALSFFELTRFQHGRNNFSLRADVLAGGELEIGVKGSSFDLEPVLANITDRPDTEPEAVTKKMIVPPLELNIDLGKVLGKDNLELARFVTDISYDGKILNQASVSADIGSSGRLSIASNITNGLRTVKADVDDVGAILSILHLVPLAEGGVLTSEGRQLIADGPLTGQMQMRDLKITEAPFVAHLLRVTSMKGLLSSLTSRGLTIDRAKSLLEIEDSRLRFKQITILADGAGVTADGTIDFDAGTTDFTGYLTPAATIQRVIGKIPLLGRVLTGVNREGIIATEFSITGSLKKPVVKTKTLSTLTPGITRDLFRFKSIDSEVSQPPED